MFVGGLRVPKHIACYTCTGAVAVQWRWIAFLLIWILEAKPIIQNFAQPTIATPALS